MNIIFGGGPAGMFCAHELKSYGQECLILEKTGHLGGLAATHKMGIGHYEVGPHIFYTNDEYILSIVRQYLGSELIHKTWDVTQYVEGHFLKFPNSALEMAQKLGVKRMCSFLISYLKHRGRSYNNYVEFIYSKVGKGLAHFNVINYTEKMWGVDLNELETEWIKPRLDRLSLVEILKNALTPKERKYEYPRHGAGSLYITMEPHFNVHKSEFPIEINLRGNRAVQVITNKSSYEANHIFSSLPIIELLRLIRPEPPQNIWESARSLRYRSQIYVILGIHADSVLNNQWVYFNEKKIPFCRIHEPKKFTDYNPSPGETILVTEYFCFHGDDLWSKEEEQIKEMTIKHIEQIGFKLKTLVKDSKVIKKKYAYPLMVEGRQSLLADISEYLCKIANLHNIGRHGLHTYDNQDTAGRSAINAVRNVFGEKVTF